MEDVMLAGEVAVVSGGTRGIGAGITRDLARNGVRVGAGYSRGKENADALQAAMELAQRGITVSAVAPGFIETEMVAKMPAGALEKYIERIPVRRIGTPEDVANVVEFLLRDGSSYITGATYSVTGGMDLGW
jgi:NAD(P)-dependent dehydrogenase (short-subunit alcohol dehydrogenase family)